MTKLYAALNELRPEIRDLIFEPQRVEGAPLKRASIGPMPLFERLGQEADLDALAACLGLIHEARYFDNEIYYCLYTKPTFSVFHRCFSTHPYHRILLPFAGYLFEHFLNNPEGDRLLGTLDSQLLFEITELCNYRYLIIEDLGVLSSLEAQAACLHIAERYLSAELIHEFRNSFLAGNSGLRWRHPKILKLKAALKRWDKKNNIHH